VLVIIAAAQIPWSPWIAISRGIDLVKLKESVTSEEVKRATTIIHFLPTLSASIPKKKPVAISMTGYAEEIAPRSTSSGTSHWSATTVNAKLNRIRKTAK